MKCEKCTRVLTEEERICFEFDPTEGALCTECLGWDFDTYVCGKFGVMGEEE